MCAREPVLDLQVLNLCLCLFVAGCPLGEGVGIDELAPPLEGSQDLFLVGDCLPRRLVVLVDLVRAKLGVALRVDLG